MMARLLFHDNRLLFWFLLLLFLDEFPQICFRNVFGSFVTPGSKFRGILFGELVIVDAVLVPLSDCLHHLC